MTTQPTLRAILIAPETKTVSEIFIPQNSDLLEEYYKIIGNNCEIISYGTSMIVDDVVIDAICDDDILLRTEDIVGGCWYNKETEQATIIVNNVILVATDEETGTTINNTMTIAQAEAIIEWISKEEAIAYAKEITEGGFEVTVY
jgi:hypothetical protein